MLDDLARHSADLDALRDRLPYVLDLLSGVTRSIDAENKGRRTPAFSAWWKTVDRSAQQAINEMRNAELKELVTGTRYCRKATASDHAALALDGDVEVGQLRRR
jgi:hypothetical protein